jgi:cell division protein FtsQ
MGARHRPGKLQPVARRRWRLWSGRGGRGEDRASARRSTKAALREQTLSARAGRTSAAAAAKRAAARRPVHLTAPSLREQQARRRARLRVALALLAVVVLGSGGAGLYRGMVWLRAQPLFNLQGFDVVVDGIGGPGITAVYFAERYLAPHRGESLFVLDLAAVRNAIQADPWVERVVVTRWLPDRLRLQVGVRDAVAVVTAGLHGWLVDREGQVIEKTENFGATSLVRIRLGPSERRWVEQPAAIHRALTAVQVSQRRGFPSPDEIRHLRFDELGDPVLVAEHGGIEIFLGRGDYPTKLDRLARILPDVAESKQRVARIDLRFKDRAVVVGPG